MFEDADYVKWANEETVHVLSYSLDPNAEKPEPTVDVDRGGTKTTVFAAYPMFTAEEMQSLLGELGKRVEYPTKTPWAGVLSPDGKQRFAEAGRGTAKEYRAIYEAGQKKMGAPLDRPTWTKVRAAVQASQDAEYDAAWKKAVASALEARALEKGVPPPLAELIESRVTTLVASGRDLLRDARKGKDPAAVAKALAKIREDFAGLPVADEAR